MKRELICIGCPMGCHLTAEIENGVVTRVTGNTCRRGEDYAKKECVAPMRTVTGTVALRGGRLPVLPVRTNGEVPKEKVLAVAEALRSAVAQAPPCRRRGAAERVRHGRGYYCCQVHVNPYRQAGRRKRASLLLFL